MKRAARLLLFSILILSIGVPPIRGQSAEFPYHGVLTAAGVPADGLFDLQFRLYDALEGGAQIGPTLWRENLVVRNGVFATRLDFGSAPFSGPERFLEVGVRLGQSTGGFSILTPRELLRPAPSALISQGFSGELAGDVAGPQAATRVVAINGVGVAAREPRDGQVLRYDATTRRYEPADLVRNGSPNIVWENVTATQIQIMPNRGYLLRPSSSATHFTLLAPAAPAVGDLIRINGLELDGWSLVSTHHSQRVLGVPAQWYPRDPIMNWTSIAASRDGRRLVAAANYVYTSTDSGLSWTRREQASGCSRVASSADGARLAAIGYGGRILISSDGGETWAAQEESRAWSAIAINADGTRLAATVFGGPIYLSSDAGQSWSASGESRNWTSVAISASGLKLAAVARDEPIYLSNDAGRSWRSVETARAWQTVSISADGQRIIAAPSPGNLHLSTDGGSTWTQHESERNWQQVLVSANGESWTALARQIHLATNSGMDWQERELDRNWSAMAMSEDGRLKFATVSGGYFYRNFNGNHYEVLLNFTVPTAATLIYLGDGRYARLP